MACNLVTNLDVALIKKPWQCSALSRTLPPWGSLRYLNLITFAFSCYSRCGGGNCRPDRRETGTQIGQIGKTENRIGYQIRKPVSIFRENRKPNAKQRKIRKPAMNNKTEKLKFFWHKNRKTDLKNSQNRKTENPNAPHNRLF